MGKDSDQSDDKPSSQDRPEPPRKPADDDDPNVFIKSIPPDEIKKP